MSLLEPIQELVAFGCIGCDSGLGARFDQEGPTPSRETFLVRLTREANLSSRGERKVIARLSRIALGLHVLIVLADCARLGRIA